MILLSVPPQPAPAPIPLVGCATGAEAPRSTGPPHPGNPVLCAAAGRGQAPSLQADCGSAHPRPSGFGCTRLGCMGDRRAVLVALWEEAFPLMGLVVQSPLLSNWVSEAWSTSDLREQAEVLYSSRADVARRVRHHHTPRYRTPA